MTKTTHFDVIVIGSGIGGLTTASLLAQVAKKRVLVLERHFKLGGLTHSFQRQGFHWDVGLHYVGGMVAGSLSRQFMDLVTGCQVQWSQIADPLEHFIYPEHHVQVPSSAAAYQQHLVDLFPGSAQQIKRYFQRMHRAASWMGRWFAAKQMPKLLGELVLWPGGRDSVRTTREVLNELIDDQRLRGILASQWGDYGLPPGQSSFGIHALIAKDYLAGGWVPDGGSQRLAETIVPIIEQAGGSCLTGHEVTKLEVHQARVTRVIASHKRSEVSFTAPLVISDAGAQKTFAELIDASVSVAERTSLQDTVAPPTAVTIYLGSRPARLAAGCRRAITGSPPAMIMMRSCPSLQNCFRGRCRTASFHQLRCAQTKRSSTMHKSSALVVAMIGNLGAVSLGSIVMTLTRPSRSASPSPPWNS